MNRRWRGECRVALIITRRVDRNNSAMLWLLRATAFLCVLANAAVPNARPPPSQRTFNSSFVEALIASYTPRFIDPDLATIFSNTFPNTLDTTIVAASESAFCARTRSRAAAARRALVTRALHPPHTPLPQRRHLRDHGRH